VALTTVPAIWALLASGFELGKALFNGPWALALRSPANGHCIWDNGGDGIRIPLVELRCESPLVTTWQLTLRHGAEVVEYTRAATEWNPLGVNDVHHKANGVAQNAPAHLTLTPG
jgi:hypothetical protein